MLQVLFRMRLVLFAALLLPALALVSSAGERGHDRVSMFSDRIETFVGTYRRESDGSSGRVVEILDLRADLTATMTGRYDNRGNVLREGNWTYASGKVVVSFAPIDLGGEALVLQFKKTGGFWIFTSGNDLKLVSVEPSGFIKKGAKFERIRSGSSSD